MFFESEHSLNEREFVFSQGSKLNFPLHIHRAFEYFEQVRGSTEVTVGDRVYVLRQGDAVLIFPIQAHSYRSLEAGKTRMCIFSPEMVSHFYEKNKDLLPQDNRLTAVLPDQMRLDTLFHKKAIAYYICGEFEREREYTTDTLPPSERLMVALLLYADKNFRGHCLLRDAAFEIGYDYAYVSKLFKRKVGISFKQYVNGLRIAESKLLLRSTRKSIEEIGCASGFSSLRAFDREFREQIGVTPSQYRAERTLP